MERRDLRRAISWWKLKSGAGGAYSTGAVETRVVVVEGEEEWCKSREEEGRGLRMRWLVVG